MELRRVVSHYLILLLIRFIAFSRKLRSTFRLDRKTCSQRSHVFRLTGTAALHCGHNFVGGILTANGELAKNVSPKVSIVCGTNNHVKSEMLSNRGWRARLRQTPHRPSTVTLAAHARRGLITRWYEYMTSISVRLHHYPSCMYIVQLVHCSTAILKKSSY